MRFRGELQATGGTTTGFQIDDGFVAALGGGGRPKVAVSVNGVSWRGSIARMGGAYWLGVSAARRAEAGIAAGETHDVDVELDDAPREVELPPELAAALAEAPAQVRSFWEGLSPSNKGWHVQQVTSAKTEATRARRVEKSLALLTEGRAR